MYSNYKSIQILVSLLKQYGIKHIVLSAGTTHDAIIRSIEEDDFFTTYSVVDERSAAFFACGIAQELGERVAICCTSGTAAANYLSGITEAYRRNLPIVVITADKNAYYFEQTEDQMIDQMAVFKPVTKYACYLPIIRDAKDEWHCQRIINETLLELDHHGTGPVHINIPIDGREVYAIGNTFTTEVLPNVKKISRYDLNEKKDLSSLFSLLKDKKIMIICGQDDHVSERFIELVEKVFTKYNCIFATDKLSNIHCKGTFEVTRAIRLYHFSEESLVPDYLIMINGNSVTDIRYNVKTYNKFKECWTVNESGKVSDLTKKLTNIFEGTAEQFLENMANVDFIASTHSYMKSWEEATKEFVMPEFEYSNLYAVNKFMSRIPKNSNLNIGNSTTIRIAQYFDLDESIQVYCNRGVNGIDGCVSAFIGQAAVSRDKLNYIMVGDLTFFYDMNSLWNNNISSNVRILLINNGGAALFNFNQGVKNYPNLNQNVAAEHHAIAKGWAEDQGFKYLSCNDKESFDKALEEFVGEADAPMLFEVFTDKIQDAQLQHDLFDMNNKVQPPTPSFAGSVVMKAQKIVSKIVKK